MIAIGVFFGIAGLVLTGVLIWQFAKPKAVPPAAPAEQLPLDAPEQQAVEPPPRPRQRRRAGVFDTGGFFSSESVFDNLSEAMDRVRYETERVRDEMDAQFGRSGNFSVRVQTVRQEAPRNPPPAPTPAAAPAAAPAPAESTTLFDHLLKEDD